MEEQNQNTQSQIIKQNTKKQALEKCQNTANLPEKDQPKTQPTQATYRHDKILPKTLKFSLVDAFRLQQTDKNQIEKVQPLRSQITPFYKLGFILDSIGLKQADSCSAYKYKKTGGFFSSRFEFEQMLMGCGKFKLQSNFSGSVYNLYQYDCPIMTICFHMGCFSVSEQSRRIDIYILKDAKQVITSFINKEGRQSQQKLDLSLIELHKREGQSKVMKLTNIQPFFSSDGLKLSLKFSEKGAVPSIENCILCNESGQRMMQLFRKNDNQFTLLRHSSMQKQWYYAFALACFDFKLCTQ